MTTYIFAGPTITPSEVEAVLPEALYKPPIKHGDLYSLNLGSEDTVAIIDGLFFQSVCVRHQEILHALQAGARVVGAASMGAIRAAELRQNGMEGFGTFYRCLTMGILDGDDEVTVAHSHEGEGYRGTSDALLNMRCTFIAMERAGHISRATMHNLILSAKERVFYDRTAERVLHDSIHGSPRITTLLEEYRTTYRNVKKQDAKLLLRALRGSKAYSNGIEHVLSEPSTRVGDRTVYAIEWHAESLRDEQGESLDFLLSAAQAAASDYPDFRFRANVALMAALQRGLRIRPFIPADHSPERYDEILELIPGQPLELNTKLLTDAFALISESGGYDPDSKRASLSKADGTWVIAALRNASLNFAVAPGFQWRHLELAYLPREPHSEHLREALTTARNFNASLAELNANFRSSRISAKKMREWFTAFWRNRDVTTEVNPMLARGYRGESDLHERYGLFYPAMRTKEIVPFYLSNASENDRQNRPQEAVK